MTEPEAEGEESGGSSSPAPDAALEIEDDICDEDGIIQVVDTRRKPGSRPRIPPG